MQLTFPSRRVLGVLAAGTIGLSTALVGVAGVAQAETGDVTAPQADVAATLAAPPAPDYLEVDRSGDGSLTVSFLVYASDPDTEAEATGYEISTNNGTSFAALSTTTPYGNNEHVGTVTGLTNKQTYDLLVRATSSVGPSDNSNAVQGTPAKPNGAPVGLTVTTSAGKATASWSAPTVAGSYPVDGYSVVFYQPATENGGGVGGQLCETTAAVFTCTGDLDFNSQWLINVTAIDTEDNQGITSADVSTGVIPFPSAAPTADGPLTPGPGSSDKVEAGKTMVVSGTGYQPGSTVTILIYSTPQVLTTVVADPSGNFTATVTVPAGLAAGQHTLVGSGVDTNGDQRFTTMAVTVSAAGVAKITAARVLAYTGVDVVPPAIGGLAAVALGTGLIVLRRRAVRAAA